LAGTTPGSGSAAQNRTRSPRSPTSGTAAAIREDRLAEEMTLVTITTSRKGPVTVEDDEGVRPGTTADKLAALPPAFAGNGNITVGSSSQLPDAGARSS